MLSTQPPSQEPLVSLTGTFLINGAQCDLLQVEQNRISWTRRVKTKLKHKNSTVQDTDNRHGSSSLENSIEFNKIISIQRINGHQKAKTQTATSLADDIRREPSLRTSTYQVNKLQCTRHGNKRQAIKIYYAHGDESKTSGKLVQLKKVLISLQQSCESLEQLVRVAQVKNCSWQMESNNGDEIDDNSDSTTIDVDKTPTMAPIIVPTRHQHTQSDICGSDDFGSTRRVVQTDSAPPSCYASEGSTSRLSSLASGSSSSSSPAPPEWHHLDLSRADKANTSVSNGQSGSFVICAGRSSASKTSTGANTRQSRSPSFESETGATNSSIDLNNICVNTGHNFYKPTTKYISGNIDKAKQRQKINTSTGTAGSLLLDELYIMLDRRLQLEQSLRPKRLLVFVNPIGGKRKALAIYKSKVRKLFELAGIDHKLIVTKYANHARDTVEDPQFNVEHFDGVVTIGGDGMFAELMNGLLFRYNRDKILGLELQMLKNKNKSCDNIECCRGVETKSFSTMEQLNSSPVDMSSIQQQQQQQQRDQQRKVPRDMTNICSNIVDAKTLNAQTKQHQYLAQMRSSLGGIGQKFAAPLVTLGIIGAGSTDANAFGFAGTNDVITQTLNILLGRQISVDVCSVHSIEAQDKVLRFVSTFVGYGYFGDIARESEKLRWLGPKRYDVTGFNTLLRNRAYPGLIRIITSSQDIGTPHDRVRCHSNCSICNNNVRRLQNYNANSENEDKIEDFKLIEKQGAFMGVNAAVIACRCPQTRKGLAPSNHLANGCLDLILVSSCSRMQTLNYLLRTGFSKKSAFDLKYVEAFRCRQFEFIYQDGVSGPNDHNSSMLNNNSFVTRNTAKENDYHLQEQQRASSMSVSSRQSCSNSNSLDSSKQWSGDERDSGNSSGLSDQSERHNWSKDDNCSSWNVDGEILHERSIRVKVNHKLMRVYGTGEPRIVAQYTPTIK